MASPHSFLGAMASQRSCWPSSSRLCRSTVVLPSVHRQSVGHYSHDTETDTHCANCAAASDSTVQSLVWFLTRPLLRHVRCHGVVAVFVVECGSGEFMAGPILDAMSWARGGGRTCRRHGSGTCYAGIAVTMHLTLMLTCLLCATTGVLCFCVQKTADFLQFQYVDKVVDILVVMQRPIFMVQSVQDHRDSTAALRSGDRCPCFAVQVVDMSWRTG